MSELLKELNKNGLIEKLDGDDGRFAKIERAADSLAQEFKENSQLLIRAILAGIDPDIPANDPAIAQAEDALYQEWPSVRSIHTDSPILLYRYILLDACNQSADKLNAVILWNTIADTLPFVRLGKEEHVIHNTIMGWAINLERYLISTSISHSLNPIDMSSVDIKNFEISKIKKTKLHEIDNEAILTRIAAASGPNYRSQQALEYANQYWSNTAQHWSWDFTDRLSAFLIDQISSIYVNIKDDQDSLIEQIDNNIEEHISNTNKLLLTHYDRLIKASKKIAEQYLIDRMRLNTIWWCEALYSSSLRCSYRKMSSIIAAAIMPFDLLVEVKLPTPASVSHILAETVSKLSEASHEKHYGFTEILSQLIDNYELFPETLEQNIVHPPKEGRLSIRDVIVSILLNHDHNIENLIQRSGLSKDTQISLPRLAQAIFRQEQAVRLSQEKLENILEDAQ